MRVIVADDAPMLRSDYCRALTASGIDVVAEAATADQLIAHVKTHQPDAALIDICLRGIGPQGHDEDGLGAAERLRANYPTLGLLIFSVIMNPSYLARILRIGEHHIGYVGKDRVKDFGVVLDALHRVAAGETVIDPKLWIDLLNHRRARNRLGKLSPRKRQTLELMACGLTNKAIATEMGVEEETVEDYATQIFNLLDIPGPPDAHRRVHAVLTWLRETGALPGP